MSMTHTERVDTLMQLIGEHGNYPAKAMRSFERLPLEARDIVANQLLRELPDEKQIIIIERFGDIEAKWFAWDIYNAIAESVK